nr:unknown [uncultured bacterium]
MRIEVGPQLCGLRSSRGNEAGRSRGLKTQPRPISGAVEEGGPASLPRLLHALKGRFCSQVCGRISNHSRSTCVSSFRFSLSPAPPLPPCRPSSMPP